MGLAPSLRVVYGPPTTQAGEEPDQYLKAGPHPDQWNP